MEPCKRVLKRPDYVFVVTVHPISFLVRCEAMREEERKGLFGFHDFHRCPQCKVVSGGWELWGENGHKQGSVEPDNPGRPALAYRLRHLAGKQWHSSQQPGKVWGYRFRQGSRLFYSVR